MPIVDSVYVWYFGNMTMKMSVLKKLHESKELKNRLHMFLCVSGWKAHGGTGSLQRGVGKIKRPQRTVSEKGTAGIFIINLLKCVFQSTEMCI